MYQHSANNARDVFGQVRREPRVRKPYKGKKEKKVANVPPDIALQNWVDNTPDYVVCPQNRDELVHWMMWNLAYMDPTRNTIEQCLGYLDIHGILNDPNLSLAWRAIKAAGKAELNQSASTAAASGQITAASIRAGVRQLAAMNIKPGQIYYRSIGPYPWDTPASPPPKLDVAKIDQLATVEARKVKPKIVIPDLTTCIIGWRGWRVTTSGNEYRLQGLGRDAVWEPKKPVKAECKRDTFFSLLHGEPGPEPHDCPGKDCSCGVWAFRSLDEFKKMGESYSSTAVVGQVFLWGRVLECENGYRAQFAVPKELWVFDPEHESLGIHYNCPIRSLGKKEDGQ